MKWNIDDVPVFVAVVDQGGMTAAAETLGMPKSTVSTSIARLEKALGLRLLERNSRNIRVTAEGASFYHHALLILEQVREADATAVGLRADPSGRLTAALPPAFCQEVLGPLIPKFARAYPNIELELISTSHGVDLLRDAVDVAVVVGPMVDSDLVARTLISGGLTWVATPDYLAGKTLRPGLAGLREHLRICETRYGLRQTLVQVDGVAAVLDLETGISRVNNPLVVRAAVLNGAGIAPLPPIYLREHLAKGTLVEVYPEITFDGHASTLSAVYLSRRLMSPRLRAFLDFLADACR